MTYHFSKTVDMSFDDAVMSTKEALKRHGVEGGRQDFPGCGCNRAWTGERISPEDRSDAGRADAAPCRATGEAG